MAIDSRFVSEFEEIYYKLGHYPRNVIVNIKKCKTEYQRMNIEYNFSEV